MTAGSIFVRTAAIAARTGRLPMNRPQKFFTEGNKGNEGKGGQAVVQAWLKRHSFVSFCEKTSRNDRGLTQHRPRAFTEVHFYRRERRTLPFSLTQPWFLPVLPSFASFPSVKNRCGKPLGH
jgi:hypothetical protein